MSLCWTLDRYARFITAAHKKSEEEKKSSSWKHFDNTTCPLLMTITDDYHLLITQGSKVLESHNLTTANSIMRGLSRTDSLLILYKVKNETRRFRVRFCQQKNKTGTEMCIIAAQALSNFMAIKMNSETKFDLVKKLQKVESNTDQSLDAHPPVFERDVTIGSLAKAVINKHNLPLAYSQHQTNEEICPHLLHICFSDPTFPAFVESVESAIHQLISDAV
ncbi:meiotic recombination protein REC114-like [Physella acuta]|uniref:meiotic recombination protein REC114-like n=1 Tax=Physella acuta TaxID=109671 RepID=UPI0027DD8150|nr:meiotic recombination protein REC114-like [Physella acuta]